MATGSGKTFTAISLLRRPIKFAGARRLDQAPEPIDYNPAFPIRTSDIIVTDEAYRSVCNAWRQVLKCFDNHLIGRAAYHPRITVPDTRLN